MWLFLGVISGGHFSCNLWESTHIRIQVRLGTFHCQLPCLIHCFLFCLNDCFHYYNLGSHNSVNIQNYCTLSLPSTPCNPPSLLLSSSHLVFFSSCLVWPLYSMDYWDYYPIFALPPTHFTQPGSTEPQLNPLVWFSHSFSCLVSHCGVSAVVCLQATVYWSTYLL